MRKMVIGILPTYKEDKKELYNDYYKFISLYTKKVIEAGAIPIGILLDGDNLSKESLDICDGFIIPGGNKIYYYVYEVIDYAIKNNKPLIGVCMGAEAIDIYSVISEYMDKDKSYTKEELVKIYQALKEKNEGTLLRKLDINNIHNNDFNTIDDYENCLHEIKINENSISYSIFGDKVNVPSMHNYDFKYIGSSFKGVGYASDNVCEIIEYNKKDYFIIGVHFHPELTDSGIFKRLVLECELRK